MMLKTRKPTGRPSWPLILLAGVEKAGKSYAAAEASTSPLLGATYWISCGEDDPDELGRIGSFEIVEHDGSYNGIRQAVLDINNLPADGKPSLIVLDSISMVWAMLTDEAQITANDRAARKAARSNKPAPADDVSIGVDLWNRAAGKWRRLMDALRAHQGPVLLTARLNHISVMKNGEPTGEKDWKIEGHKTLPFDSTVIVQLRSRSERYLTGVRSIIWQTEPEALLPFPPGRTVADLWELLGITEAEDRVHRSPDGAASLAVEQEVRAALLARLAAVSSDMAKVDAHWQQKHGEPLADATDLKALLELTEWGERVHAEHQTQQRPPAPRVDTLPEPEPELPIEQPPAPSAVDVEEPRKRVLLSQVAQQFSRLGITLREERLFYTAELLRLPPLTSSNSLTPEQVGQLGAGLRLFRNRQALEDHLNNQQPQEEASK